MTLSKSIFLLVFTNLLFQVTTLNAQIWPGDVDNNGEADNVDLLYLGYAYGQTGPQRTSTSIDWLAQPSGLLWGTSFPGQSLDLSYADCNGDGVVDDTDIQAISQNYASVHQTVTVPPIIAGVPGIAPTVEIKRSTTDTLSEGAVEFFELHLGPNHYPSFYGISFTVSFDTAYVDSVLQVFPATGWINNNDLDRVVLVSKSYIEPNATNGKHGRLDIAYSRTNGIPIMGSGLMGLFAIIMEDNINGKTGGFINFDFEVLDIRMVDDQLNFQPTASSISEFYILTTGVNDLILDETDFKIYPNPASHKIITESIKREIIGYELYNLQGQLVQYDFFEARSVVEFLLDDELNGMHLLKIQTPKGLLVKKIMIVNQR